MKLTFSMKISKADQCRIDALLRGIKDAGPKATLRALNSAMISVRADVADEVSAVITAQRTVIDQAITLIEATPQHFSGAVVVIGKSLPLIEYTNWQSPTGICVQVKHGRAPVVIPGSFYARAKSGRAGIFRRKWSEATAKPRRGRVAYGRLPAIYRLPIKELFSSSIPNVASDVMPAILEKADERLQTNLKEEIDGLFQKL